MAVPVNSAEDAQRVQEFLNITFDTIDQGVTIYDDQLRLVAWNKVYATMEITPDEFLYYGSSLLETYTDMARRGVFGPGNPHLLARGRVQALQSGPLIETELLTPPTGKIIRIRRFQLPNGGVCATFADITNETRLQERLAQAQRLEATGRLTAGVAHDFNNLLAVIMRNLEMIDADTAEQSTTSMAGTALQAARRGAELAQKLLAFGREARLLPEITDVNTLVRKAEPMLRQTLDEEVTLHLSLAEGVRLIEVDRTQLENALLNLVHNSQDAIPSDGVITVKTMNLSMDAEDSAGDAVSAGPSVSISVSDTGVGMDGEVAGRAFDPFFTTKPAGEGSGLGLATIYGFVTQSDGEVQVRSEPGVGTTVEIRFPATAE